MPAAKLSKKKRRRAKDKDALRSGVVAAVQRPREPGTRRILVADDEPRILAFLSRALTTCGFGVECARSGAAAIGLVDKRPFDLVLLDLLLPAPDGFAVLQHIQEVRPSQEVLVLSALSDVETKVRCFELGAADFVVKPFVLAELVARVRLRVRRAGTLDAARFLHHGNISLDLQRHLAIVDGRSVYLSSREFLLLEHLIRRAGEVCTRVELLQAVWGISFDTGTNVVDVYVRRLRTKLGGDAVETIRSVGYCCGSAA